MWTLKLIWYHVFQFCFSIAEYFLTWRQPQLLTGADSVLELPALIKSKGISRVLIVTDKALLELGALAPLMARLGETGVEYALFDGVEPNPSIENIEAARTLFLEKGCQGLLPFGGGSSMDCAKACGARIVKPHQSIEQMGGTLKVLHKLPPVFAVPTTAGTGSETTLAAVVTNRQTHHKYAINDPSLFPHYAVLDPMLTVGLPKKLTSTTGMDALTHAVEAYTNRLGPKYTQALAEDAVRLIFDNLEAAYNDGHNVQARENMLHASFKAGAAFTRACVGNVHAIAHTLGGFYGTPHGLANAVLLPHVMRAYGPAVHKKLARLADIVGIQGADDAEKANKFIDEMYRMNRDMGIPDSFDFIKDEDIPLMIKYALKEANPIYPVPVIWNADKLREVIEGIRTKA